VFRITRILLTKLAENKGRNQKPFSMHTMHNSARLHPLSQSTSQHCPEKNSIQCRISKREPTQYDKYEAQSVLQNSHTVTGP